VKVVFSRLDSIEGGGSLQNYGEVCQSGRV